jgi:exopolysaccharide production protein ExoQ
LPPGAATLVFITGILVLFWLDRERAAQVSRALWIPTIWMLIAGSRMISEWRVAAEIDSPDQYFEGSPLDRVVLAALLVAGVTVLVMRARSAQTFLRRNVPILLFFAYCGASIIWSDYSAVAFKRWTKALGDLVMVMVVLTDPDPLAAIRRLFARTSFVLIPISVLLVKYYPELGRGYDRWTWTPYYGGVAIGKNGLGYVCLVFGLASLWRFLTAFYDDERRRLSGSLIAHGFVVTMAMWLFWIANSATSLGCFILGAGLLALTTMPAFARAVKMPHVLTGIIMACAFMVVLLNAGNVFVQAMGRDTTLTGRTELWDRLLQMRVDPLFGAGFESFWLGDRVEKLWSVYWWHPRQAHNGYLETFLNLGIAGLAVLGFLLAAGYRDATAAFRRNPAAGSLGLTFLVVALTYNLTEAAFKTMHPVWIALLVATGSCVASRSRQPEHI